MPTIGWTRSTASQNGTSSLFTVVGHEVGWLYNEQWMGKGFGSWEVGEDLAGNAALELSWSSRGG